MRRFIALTAVLAFGSAQAQEGLGGYVGLGIDNLDYEDNMLLWFDVGDKVMSTKLVAGYRFNDTLAIEGTYSNSDDFSRNMSGFVPAFRDTATSGQVFAGNYNATFTGNYDVFSVRALAHAKYMVFGISFFKSDFKGTLSGVTDGADMPDIWAGNFSGSVSDGDNGYSIIIGAQWDIGNWAVRPEYEYFDVSSPSDASQFGVQFHYGF